MTETDDRARRNALAPCARSSEIDVMALGPGISLQESPSRAPAGRRRDCTLVLDADGLSASRVTPMDHAGRAATRSEPNLGERLASRHAPSDLETRRIDADREWGSAGAVVVIKGAPTVTAGMTGGDGDPMAHRKGRGMGEF